MINDLKNEQMFKSKALCYPEITATKLISSGYIALKYLKEKEVKNSFNLSIIELIKSMN